MATPSIPEGHQSPSGLLEHPARPVEREDTENTHWLRGQRLTLQAPGRMRKWLLRAGLVMSGFGGALWYGIPLWHYYQTHVSTDNAAVVGAVIPISAHVSGLVVAVLVENGQHVTPGQTVVQLDPDTFAARMAQAEEAVTVATMRLQQAVAEVHFVEEHSRSETARASATVREAQSALEEAQQHTTNAQAQIQGREAVVAAAAAAIRGQQARLEVAVTSVQRLQSLSAEGLVSRQQLEEAEGTLRVRRAELQAGASQLQHAQSELARAHAEQQGRLKEVDKARARLEAMQAQLIGSQAQKQTLAMKRAQVKVAESLLKQAQIDREQARKQLADTTVSVPMAGTIARKRVEPGQSIREGQPLLALVPLEQIWVEAHFKETQLRDIHPGQAVTLHVDTYPGKVFRGVVASLSPGTGAIFSLLPPENATGNFVKVVQRVTVHITVDTASLHGLVLRPGMSVLATVQTS